MPRRHEDEYRRTVRPSTLQKLVKKYDGSGDPYDHVAAFRQAVHAEQVRDTHTQIEGFGLTLESKALAWFQTLDQDSKVSLGHLEKDFIAAFSKMGIKHNAVGQIYAFKQHDYETVRDCVSRLKQYINRCPEEEKPSQGRLISIFLEGLKNTTLHDHLYAKKHDSFNECCLDAMDYDDNFHRKGSSNDTSFEDRKIQERTRETSSSTTKELTQDQLVELVLKRLGQTYRPYRPTGYPTPTNQGPQSCGICAGAHRTEMCTSYMPGANGTPTRKWCQMCRWNPTHNTQECVHILRMARERDFGGQAQQMLMRQEQAKPVLGSQPPPPGAAPIKYVEPDFPTDTGLEIVSSTPYYQDDEQNRAYSLDEYADWRFHGDYQYEETNPFMLLGPGPKQFTPYPRRPPPPGVKCYRCGEDHWARDCPLAPVGPPRPRLPPIERYCAKCCEEHFPKDCPEKPVANLPPPPPTTGLKLVEVISSPIGSEQGNEEVSLRVITRAQAVRGHDDGLPDVSTHKKKRRRRKLRSKQSKKSRAGDDDVQEEGRHAKAHQPVLGPDILSAPSSGGSVIVDKIYEPLHAAVQAYNDRITPLSEIPKKLQEYPNARAEKVALATNSQLIRDTQTMLEGPPRPIVRGPVSQNPSLETILEATPSVEFGAVQVDPTHQRRNILSNLTRQASEARMLEDGIPEVEEQMAAQSYGKQ